MAQVFSPAANAWARLTIAGGVAAVCLVVWASGRIFHGPYWTRKDVIRQQPVPFSHQHHVGGLGLDCRYCHTSVEDSAFAGLPSTDICMDCHAHIWTDAPALEPVRDSYLTGLPLRWTRVTETADFVYFDHSIHVAKGVGCETCHGNVAEMPITRKVRDLWMQTCLDCHRHPERYVRPREAVFVMGWEPPPDRPDLGRALVAAYDIGTPDSCSVCHR
jgi:hypothetical protein